MLHFQKRRRRVDELVDTELYTRVVEFLERIVAMLTTLIDP
jgi:hypothetical protein